MSDAAIISQRLIRLWRKLSQNMMDKFILGRMIKKTGFFLPVSFGKTEQQTTPASVGYDY
jgi:hypothetical protein